MKPLRILITGGTGYFAAPIIAQLKPRAEIILTDIAPKKTEEKLIVADLMDFDQTLALMDGIDVIIHLAVASPYIFSEETKKAIKEGSELNPYEQNMLRVNGTMTYHLLEAARRTNVRRMVYASSLTIHYGDKTRDHYDTSDYPLPQNLYACLKLFGENLAQVYGRTYGLETLCLRYGQPFPCKSNRLLDDGWRGDARACSAYITLEDIGRVTEAAVYTPLTQGVFHALSDSELRRFDLTSTFRMGYVPTGKFTAHGLLYRKPGTEEWIPDPKDSENNLKNHL